MCLGYTERIIFRRVFNMNKKIVMITVGVVAAIAAIFAAITVVSKKSDVADGVVSEPAKPLDPQFSVGASDDATDDATDASTDEATDEATDAATDEASDEEADNTGDVYVPISDDAVYFTNNDEFLAAMDEEHLKCFRSSIPSNFLEVYPTVTFLRVDENFNVFAEDEKYDMEFDYYAEDNHYSSMAVLK